MTNSPIHHQPEVTYSDPSTSDPFNGDDRTETSSTTEVAKDEAGLVKDTAVNAGENVAATAKNEAANVVDEAKQQAKGLFGSVTSELSSQASTQQQNIASSIHSLSKELGAMASGSSESGPLTDLAHQAAAKGGEIAHWLQNKEPRDVLREVTSFGRRRPVAFLALCGLAGVLAGRLTRGAVAANTSVDSPSPDRDSSDDARRALPATRSASLVHESDRGVDDPYVESGYTSATAYSASPGYGKPDDLGAAR